MEVYMRKFTKCFFSPFFCCTRQAKNFRQFDTTHCVQFLSQIYTFKTTKIEAQFFGRISNTVHLVNQHETLVERKSLLPKRKASWVKEDLLLQKMRKPSFRVCLPLLFLSALKANLGGAVEWSDAGIMVTKLQVSQLSKLYSKTIFSKSSKNSVFLLVKCVLCRLAAIQMTNFTRSCKGDLRHTLVVYNQKASIQQVEPWAMPSVCSTNLILWVLSTLGI